MITPDKILFLDQIEDLKRRKRMRECIVEFIELRKKLREILNENLMEKISNTIVMGNDVLRSRESINRFMIMNSNLERYIIGIFNHDAQQKQKANK